LLGKAGNLEDTMRTGLALVGLLLTGGTSHAGTLTAARLQSMNKTTLRPTVAATTFRAPTGWTLFKQSPQGDLGEGKWLTGRATKGGQQVFRLAKGGNYLAEDGSGKPFSFLTK
jgi:hypothetical protein